ncbi:hypothetical protein BSKO_09976 [Bryopsis sp. KO-2023]|nr:hypothetical protein BSKO_09976 [Bryopsis sp. KO-2023]
MTNVPRRNFRKQVGDYYLGRTIGEGSYGKVKYGQHVTTGEPVAIKVLNKKDLIQEDMVEQIKREIAITKHLNHPNVVDLKEVMASRDKIYMVMELLTGGELFDKIAEEGPMLESEARVIFQQLIEGLEYCHRQGIYHRDLKPENVLLTAEGTVKLSDFGLGALPSQYGSPDNMLKTTCGTPNYVAPEVLKRTGYLGGPADIWSAGVVLYVVLVGRLPFDDRHLSRLFKKIVNGQFDMPRDLTTDAKDVLRKMICPDPTKRITIPELKQHPWVAKDYPVFAVESSESSVDDLGADLFTERVELRRVPMDDDEPQQGPRSLTRLDSKTVTAFDLIGASVDLSTMFEKRKDIVHRHTRFTSSHQPEEIFRRIQQAVTDLGGKVDKRSGQRVKVTKSTAQGTVLTANVEVFDLSPGISMVEVSRIRGEHFHFRDFYEHLTVGLHDLMLSGPDRFPETNHADPLATGAPSAPPDHGSAKSSQPSVEVNIAT